ncbi:MAG TPA: DUF6252 family protein [Sphingobacterium sp.]|nr:DUF6252 family protein [Sphingobacterium sp.]
MKTLRNSMYATLIVLTCIMLTTACKKDSEGDGGSAKAGTIKAKVNGTAFESSAMLSAANRVTVGSSTTVTVQGNDASGKTIMLIMLGLSEPGTYAIGGAGGANLTVTASYVEVNIANPTASQTWQSPYDSSVAGEVTITELSSTGIKGSFRFKGKNNSSDFMVDITDGAFNMNF